MLQRILVPLDGSALAARALPTAARIARAQAGSLLLLTAIPPADTLAWAELPSSPPTPTLAARDAEQELARLSSCAQLTGLQVAREVAQGDPATAILNAARAHRADLIVLCSHGRSGMMRLVLGSVAQNVALQSQVPVLVLRERTSEQTHEQPGIRTVRIMVALDGSALAEQALQPAAQLSAALSAPLPGALHLVRVLPFSNDFDYGQDDAVAQSRRQDMQEARAYLHALQQRLAAATPGLHILTSLAISPDIAPTLITIAETGQGEGMSASTSTSDLLALATHGRSGLMRRGTGRVARRILGATWLPLLIVHPARTEEPDRRKESGTATR